MSYSCGKESYRAFQWNSKALPSPQVSRNIRSQTSPNATKAETPPGSHWSYCCHMANVPPPKPGDGYGTMGLSASASVEDMIPNRGCISPKKGPKWSKSNRQRFGANWNDELL